MNPFTRTVPLTATTADAPSARAIPRPVLGGVSLLLVVTLVIGSTPGLGRAGAAGLALEQTARQWGGHPGSTHQVVLSARPSPRRSVHPAGLASLRSPRRDEAARPFRSSRDTRVPRVRLLREALLSTPPPTRA